MPSRSRDQRDIDREASPEFTRLALMVFGAAALIGLVIGIIWVIAGLLYFHPLW